MNGPESSKPPSKSFSGNDIDFSEWKAKEDAIEIEKRKKKIWPEKVLHYSAFDEDLSQRVEKSAVRKKMASYSPITVAGKTASLLGGIMPVPISIVESLSKEQRIGELLKIRYECRGRWDDNHAHLFRCLIRVLDLRDVENELLQLAKISRGRKKKIDLAESVKSLSAKGKTASEIKTLLSGYNENLSEEGVKSYRATRRKKSIK